MAAGDSTNNWCRKLALTQSSEGYELTENQRLFYEEIARVRYLAGHGFRMLLGADEATAETWKRITTQADQRSERIVEDLFRGGNDPNYKQPYSTKRGLMLRQVVGKYIR